MSESGVIVITAFISLNLINSRSIAPYKLPKYNPPYFWEGLRMQVILFSSIYSYELMQFFLGDYIWIDWSD